MTFLFDSTRAASRFAALNATRNLCENVAMAGCLVTVINVFEDTKAECVAQSIELGGFRIDPKRLYDFVGSVETAIDSIDEGQSSEAVVSYLNQQTRYCLKKLLGAAQ